MSITSWILARLQGLNAAVTRSDLPPRDAGREPRLGPVAEPVLSRADHLGAYAPLIDAIRDELEHFVASHVRLHLAIADRDRFLLTSIGIGCPGAEVARELLQRFVHEFKPEQVKRYLAREVIGGLPNAAAIDLSQFAGLFDADLCEAATEEAQGGDYHELLQSLRDTPAAPAASAYEVSILGRWIEMEVLAPTAALHRPHGETPSTPLAGQRCEFDIEDAGGRRRVVLQGVVAGRRYAVGSGEGSDIRVDGTYSSRRHAELWLDHGVWWAADAGSTNGIRVEPQSGVIDPGRLATGGASGEATRLAVGSRLVLSARADGPPGDYPWLALRPPARAASMATPIAALQFAAVRTPRTAILSPRPFDPTDASLDAAATTTAMAPTQVLPAEPSPSFRITVSQAVGTETVDVYRRQLPLAIGRSRNQAVVVDRRHEGVSGHHLDIVELDESGARIVVHGDNGVSIDGVVHPPGAQPRWPVGATMLLDTSAADTDGGCALVLTRIDATVP